MCAELFAQRGFLGIERGEGLLGFALAARELRELVERALLCADLGLERGDAAGLVVFAGVELLFERGGRFAERLALLARGDERGDAALKLGARVERQAALADERAALVDLARDTEQRFAAVGGGQAVDRFTAAGIDGGKAAHGTIRARGVALQRNVALLTCESQRAAHRRERPGSVAVLVRQRAALPRRKAVEHHAKKREKRRLAGLIRRFYNIKTFRKRERTVLQLPESCLNMLEIQGKYLQNETVFLL